MQTRGETRRNSDLGCSSRANHLEISPPAQKSLDQIYKALDHYDEKELLLAMAGDQVPIRNQLMQIGRKSTRSKAYKVDGTEIDRNKTYKAINNDFAWWRWFPQSS